MDRVFSQTNPRGHSINGTFPLNDAGEVTSKLKTSSKISFEVFPARTPAAHVDLIENIKKLAFCSPQYVSVTYGAGGSSTEGSIQTAKDIIKSTNTDVMSHIAYAGQDKSAILDIASQMRATGAKHVLPLRGDSDDGAKRAASTSDRFANTVDFITALRQQGWDSVKTTAYPDTHKDAKNAQEDFDWLLKKLDAGATEAITQFFFDADGFFRLRDKLDRFGLAKALVPGILVFKDITKVLNFADKCGVLVPQSLRREFSNNTEADLYEAHSMSVLLDLCSRLASEGVDNYHFYALNNAYPTLTLLELLGYPVSGKAPSSEAGFAAPNPAKAYKQAKQLFDLQAV